MKKYLSKLYLLALFIFLAFENAYAFTITLDQATTLYIVFFTLIIVGGVFILIGKFTNRGSTRSYENEKDEDDHEIVGLVNQEKIDRKFNTDSIFKELPTFSNKKFFEDIEKELVKELKKELPDTNEIDTSNHKIVNFETTEENYVITAEYKIKIKKENEKIKENEKEKEKKKELTEEIIYLVTSKKTKDVKTTEINHTKCPKCGAKLKESNKTKCLKCGNKLEKKKAQVNNWVIEKIEKDGF